MNGFMDVEWSETAEVACLSHSELTCYVYNIEAKTLNVVYLMLIVYSSTFDS